MNNIIDMTGIVKVFPPDVVALDDVSAGFRSGEIHAIVGENGAGKSTLMKVLYGMEERNAGEIHYRGRPVRYRDPGEAIADGIGMVHQEILLIPEYTVCQNVVLGVEPGNFLGVLDEEEARRRVLDKIEEFQSNLNPDTLVEDLSVAARQKVEILKLLYRDVSILILDEPTAVLTPQEIPQFFNELRRLRDTGKTIIFISHRLDEVLELSDRITVMRRGHVVDTVEAEGTSERELASMMVGREMIFSSLRDQKKPGETVFSVDGLCYSDENGYQKLRNISFDVRAGEIVGIAGVEGNGQYELVNCITGLLDASSGSFQVNGTDLTHLPILERRKRISYVSQDRSRMGASRTASIFENTIMTHHRLNREFTRWKGLLLNFRAAARFTDSVKERFSVSMGSMDNPFSSLSGGNQQKVILGRELSLETPFALLDQPTRGLDVGSIEYVHETILWLRDQGRAVLLLSADLDELFRISDRILVMHRGEVVADHKNEETTLEQVGIEMLEGVEA